MAGVEHLSVDSIIQRLTESKDLYVCKVDIWIL